ncbi:hypothetical protein FRACYDRAFT_246469 [Fragilariopsis cylindrus CCMP1102]|uniref:Uncharacterized protein n=1 Tax=Fragilariopsis cylindrus CCMP1102 TaxID=635003 RepID=A0A1E7EXF3_9STRA|nr:hypothetical protein FRACYDRAFT_246469 [Fragilariopsis cylindrus CCMP1102]|eukprot:OEU10718.1 hypothetical protein FRACYDRAFT_246469 [Fragilariopsis cylindrus CCMP1102]
MTEFELMNFYLDQVLPYRVISSASSSASAEVTASLRNICQKSNHHHQDLSSNNTSATRDYGDKNEVVSGSSSSCKIDDGHSPRKLCREQISTGRSKSIRFKIADVKPCRDKDALMDSVILNGEDSDNTKCTPAGIANSISFGDGKGCLSSKIDIPSSRKR